MFLCRMSIAVWSLCSTRSTATTASTSSTSTTTGGNSIPWVGSVPATLVSKNIDYITLHNMI